jgi:cytochrome c556
VPPGASATATHPAASAGPALREIHNDPLQQLMIQMNALVYEQMRDELDAAQEKRQRIEALAATAGQLSGTVKAIIATLPSLKLSPEEQASFLALANNLHASAQQMETQARTNQIQAIPATLDQLTVTCGACHNLFRKSRNLLDKCRDPQQTC